MSEFVFPLPSYNQMLELIEGTKNSTTKVLFHSNTTGASTGQEVTIPSDRSYIIFRLDGTSVNANFSFEASWDNGTRWKPLMVKNISNNEVVTDTKELGYYQANISGLGLIRVRISQYESGTITVEGRLSKSNGESVVNAQIGNSVDLPTYDRHAKRMFPKDAYAKPEWVNIGSNFRVRGYDKETNTVYGYNNLKTLVSTKDNFVTVQTGYVFPDTIQKVVVSATHILVSTWSEDKANGGRMWRTLKSNGVTGVFEEIPEFNMGAHVYVDRMGFYSYYDYKRSDGSYARNYVFASEYGNKTVANGATANKVYFSKDGGLTFSVIFQAPVKDEVHVHTVKYDKYMDRIWISIGDGGDSRIIFSDDFGANWVTASKGYWPTTIIPMPRYVLFGGDNPPMGVHRWNRSTEERERAKTRNPAVMGDIWKAFEPNFFPIRGNLAGDSNFSSEEALIGDWEAYIPFQGVGSGVRKTFIVATGDGGETCHIVWHDSVSSPYFGFCNGLFALNTGDIVTHYSDNKASTEMGILKIPKIEWEKY